jgi:subtilisin family serine protease
MKQTEGVAQIAVGLVDGPVAVDHPDLVHNRIKPVAASVVACSTSSTLACVHGTFVAGVLSARRGSAAPAICPGCTLLVRPIFIDVSRAPSQVPNASPEELVAAARECIAAGARILNLSVALVHASVKSQRALTEVLDYAAAQGVLVVAAAGNDSTVGSSVITRHPWVIPVVAYDLAGRPITSSNLGRSIGQHGVGAPGHEITSLASSGGTVTWHGTSAAAPFITGGLALLWSLFPNVPGRVLRHAVTAPTGQRRASLIPPPLDMEGIYRRICGLRSW